MRPLPVLMLLAFMFFGNAYSQLDSYDFMSSNGSFTEISGGTLFGTTTSDDQYFTNPAAPTVSSTTGPGIPIGFNFVFNGITFDRIGVNNNGWIGFGQSALTPSVDMVSSSGYTTPLSSTLVPTAAIQRNRIAGLARDIQAQVGASLRVETIGTAPNRVCVVQFKNYRRYGSSGTGDIINFQIRLNETSNNIELAYGSMTIPSTFSPGPQVGLGGTVSTEFANRMSTISWATSVAGIANTSSMALSTTVYPAPGLTFTWSPPELGSISGKISDCGTNANLEGVSVTIGDLPPITTNSAGDYSLTNVPVGIYTITASMSGYNSTSVDVVVTANNNTLTNLCLNSYLGPPSNLDASITGQDVQLTWGAPGPQPNGQWIHWDNGNNYDGIGLTGGGTFSVASRYTPAELIGLNGTSLTKIRIFPSAAGCSFTLKVWIGENAETLVLSQVIDSFYIAQQWNEFILSNPIPITETTELWFGYTVTHPDNIYPAGHDAGPAIAGFGDMTYIDGYGWQSLATYFGINYNWNVQGFVSDNTSNRYAQNFTLLEKKTSQSSTDYQSGIPLTNNLHQEPGTKNEILKSARANSSYNELIAGRTVQPYIKFNDFLNQEKGLKSPSSTLTGYNVYRNFVKIADNISSLFFNDQNLPAGTYGYTVTAQYLEGESAPLGPVVTEIITCPEPSNLSSYNITSTSAYLTWAPGGSETAWEYVIGISPLSEPTGSGIPTNSNTVEVTDLEPGGFYMFYVRAICDEPNGNSYWQDPGVFFTDCGSRDLPFTTGFSDYNTICWSVSFVGEGVSNGWNLFNNNYAGGNSVPEIYCTYQNATGTNRFISPAINTTGLTQLKVSFQQTIWGMPYSIGCALKLCSSSDGINWLDEEFIWTSGDGDIQAELRDVIITNNLGEITYISWVVEGNLNGFSDWFIDDIMIDEVPSSKTLNLTGVIFEGLYAGGGVMNQAQNEYGPQYPGFADQINVILHNSESYSTIEYTMQDVNLNTSGAASINTIPVSLSGNYYISIRHRNSIETTTANPVSFTGYEINQSFGLPSSVYGCNLLQMIDGSYTIYGGDVNQDGVIDTGDMSPVDNDAAGFTSGYIANDVNGDGIVDTGDMTIVDNNSSSFTGSVIPSPTDLPVISTSIVSEITNNSAVCGGQVLSQGGSGIIARGVCWDSSPMPTLASSHTSDGSGTGIFTSSIDGLNPNTTYYIRSYATNSVGTSYGENLSFITLENTSQCGMIMTDPRDGKMYNTIQIGTQCWMAENLNIGTRINGSDDQTNNNILEKYCYNDDENNCNIYGGLYQVGEAKQYTTSGQAICPIGWHLPSQEEWTTLGTFLGGESIAGGKIKEAGFSHWAPPNTGATNSSGFTALPGGSRTIDGTFQSMQTDGIWWSSFGWPSAIEVNYFTSTLHGFSLMNGTEPVGFSVRCIRD